MSELYELSDGWEWIDFSKVFDTPSSKPYQIQKTEYLENGLLPIIDQGKEFIIGYTNSIEKKYLNESNCIIFGDHTRQIKYVDFDFVIGADGTKILKEKDKNKYDLKFLYFQFLSKKIESLGYSRHFKLVKEMFFAIPSLEEQKRIVAKLDILFAKIDKAIALHQKNIDEANVFMASVLNDVFVEFEEKYEKDIVKNILKMAQYGFSNKSSDDGKYPFLRMGDLQNGKILLNNLKYVNLTDEEFKKYKLQKFDLLFNRTNSFELVGKTSIFEEDIDMSFASYLVRLRVDEEKLLPYYLNYYLNTKNTQNVLKEMATKAVNQSNINAEKLKSITIPLPALKTQQKIVSYLDEISNKMEKIKQIQKEKMQSLKALKASILDQAFRGEL